MRLAFVLVLSALWSLAVLLVRAPLGLAHAWGHVVVMYFAALPWGVLGYLLATRRARAVR